MVTRWSHKAGEHVLSEPDNPAGRLLRLLREAKARPNPERAASTHWMAILGARSHSELLDSLARVVALPEEVRQSVLSLPDVNHDLLLRGMPNIVAGLNQLNLEAQFATFMNRIQESDLVALEFCDDVLSRRRPEMLIGGEELADLESRVSDLFEEVAADEELDPVLREFILRHLDAIEDAIRWYRVDGVQALRRAIETATGAVVLDSRVQQVPKNEKFERFWAIVARAALLVGVLHGTLELPSAVTKALSPPPAEQPAEPPSTP